VSGEENVHGSPLTTPPLTTHHSRIEEVRFAQPAGQTYESLDWLDALPDCILTLVVFVAFSALSDKTGTGSSIGRGLGIVIGLAFFCSCRWFIAASISRSISTLLITLLAAGLLGLLIIFQPELREG